MSDQQVAALLLAAGESTRMGQLKQLLPWAGTTLVEWQVAQLKEAGADDVVVVLGHASDRIGEAVSRSGARIALNPAYREGRASSVRAGASALSEDSAAVVVLSVDQPRPAWITRSLIEAWRQSRAPLVIPTFAGRRGHPILLDGSLIEELRTVSEADLGLRAVTTRHTAESDLVPIDKMGVNIDLNTRSDYDAALASFNSGIWNES
jgi:molybdenum cofactor cytidylyltransferase